MRYKFGDLIELHCITGVVEGNYVDTRDGIVYIENGGRVCARHESEIIGSIRRRI